MPFPVAEPLGSGNTRGRVRAEILIVLALSLGASAVYSVVQILDLLTRSAPLSNQTAQLNTSLDSREIFDFVYQVLGNGFDLVPVVLVGFLLWKTARPHLGRLGVDFSRFGRDALLGAALALSIGIPGLALYFAGRAIGITVDVVPTNLAAHWWTVPVLLFSALRSGITEEVIVVAYLFARLKDLSWRPLWILLAAALLRGTYHLYQGFGAFIGNAVMGLVFGWLYMRFGRILPLVIAHFLMDAAVFVGYPWAAAAFPALFGS
ncbi:CPBP family intramembrane glutamic endopeptidase [Frondihabitans sp. PhB188]|uniref:CPBP family intramembrane glutamic endopeptidase n=1 Tax=Frondihabitans sp. PhB188 TaxID=2485200 RepID=UPI000F49C2B2|nr:CPBP family intramembrane glutamic endopeptidase [Frondihabitans sp. PhB188]